MNPKIPTARTFAKTKQQSTKPIDAFALVRMLREQNTDAQLREHIKVHRGALALLEIALMGEK